MQVVVDIPGWLYFAIQEHREPIYSQSLGEAVRDGTPLPKGHGRLKDVDHYIKMQWEHPDYSLTDDEPTIIEADEAESEG